MGRKKKEKADPEAEKPAFQFDQILGSDAKRSIAAVFLFTLSILIILGFFGASGLLGEWLDAGLGSIFGWGKWLFPLVLMTASAMLLRRRETTLSDIVKFIGLGLAFAACLGLLHLFSGDTSKEYMKLAKAGEGGGYIGYGLAASFLMFTGKAAGAILLVALFLAGVISAFNVSLIHFAEKLFRRVPSGGEPPAGEESEGPALAGQETPPASEEEAFSLSLDAKAADESQALPEDALHANNIRNVEFRDEEDIELPQSEETDSSTPAGAATSAKRRRRRSKYAWELPPVDLLESTTGQAVGGDTERNKHIIQNTLKYFGIDVTPGEVKVGPTVTQYTFTPGMGVKLSKITTLNNDLALALAAHPIRIEAPIPGQSLIGIEVPNKSVATVRLRAIVESREFKDRKSNLTLVMGQDVSGKNLLADLRKMPHLLIAGRTGSGKSVCINTLILSLLYQNSPEDLKLLLVDPKRVELSAYKNIPHLRADVIVDNKKVVNVLKWAVGEMERRYKILEEAHTRDLMSYREKCARGETKTVIDPDTNKVREEELEPLPYIVIVIDEMADLMVAHGKEVESLVIRLAQMSRAIGIHLVLATQRPSVEVLTGLIKANVPTRVAFQVTTQIDSRTILDTGGAEKLLGNGDMLYAPSEGTDMKRLQGVFVSDDEVKRVTSFLKKQKEEMGDEEDEEDVAGDEAKDDIMRALDAGH